MNPQQEQIKKKMGLEKLALEKLALEKPKIDKLNSES